MAACILCGATRKDKAGGLAHEPACPHFMRGPDPGGDPSEWPTLLEPLEPEGGAELRKALRLAPELTAEAFRACVLARNLVDERRLELPPEVVALLERERHYGRALDAHEAARAVAGALGVV